MAMFFDDEASVTLADTPTSAVCESRKRIREPSPEYEVRRKRLQFYGALRPPFGSVEKTAFVALFGAWVANTHERRIHDSLTGRAGHASLPPDCIPYDLLPVMVDPHTQPGIWPKLRVFSSLEQEATSDLDSDPCQQWNDIVGLQSQSIYLSLIFLISIMLPVIEDETTPSEIQCEFCKRSAKDTEILTIAAEQDPRCCHPNVKSRSNVAWSKRFTSKLSSSQTNVREGSGICLQCLYERLMQSDQALMDDITFIHSLQSAFYLNQVSEPDKHRRLCACQPTDDLETHCLFRFSRVCRPGANSLTIAQKLNIPTMFEQIDSKLEIEACIKGESVVLHRDDEGYCFPLQDAHLSETLRAISPFTRKVQAAIQPVTAPVLDDPTTTIKTGLTLSPPRSSPPPLALPPLQIPLSEPSMVTNAQLDALSVEEHRTFQEMALDRLEYSIAKSASLQGAQAGAIVRIAPSIRDLQEYTLDEHLEFQQQSIDYLRSFYTSLALTAQPPGCADPNIGRLGLPTSMVPLEEIAAPSYCKSCGNYGHSQAKVCPFVAKRGIKPRANLTLADHYAGNILEYADKVRKGIPTAVGSHFAQATASVVSNSHIVARRKSGEVGMHRSGPSRAFIKSLGPGRKDEGYLPAITFATLAAIEVHDYTKFLELDMFFDLTYLGLSIVQWQKSGYAVGDLLDLQEWVKHTLDTFKPSPDSPPSPPFKFSEQSTEVKTALKNALYAFVCHRARLVGQSECGDERAFGLDMIAPPPLQLPFFQF